MPCCQQTHGIAIVHLSRRQQSQARMMMSAVVPGEVFLAERFRLFQGGKANRKLRTVFERLERRLRKRIVITDVRTTVRLGDTQLQQQRLNRLALHRRAAIRVKAQLPSLDALVSARLAKKLLGQVLAFAIGRSEERRV